MKLTLLNLTIVAGCVLSTPLGAQDQPSDDASRGVARISFLNGDVSVRRGDSGEVVAAAVNAPLVAQDTLLTGSGATAEIQFDSANMIRLGQNAEVRLAELAYRRAQMQVANGTVTFRVLRDSDSRMEIETPQVSVRPTRLGSYRITIREDGTSEVVVRSGEADIFTPRGSEPLGAGQMIVARGTAADPEFQVLAAPALDDWDRWNDNRDSRFAPRRSYQYVNPDIYGAEDLDDNGDWVDSQYGRAWRPRVAANWAPYRNGHWAWIDYYGWTWVSDDSWGWAPYHYGNWFHDDSFGWAWYPGAYDYPHYYWSPALVAFVGFGHGFGVGFGFGNIGWVPLAPYETCHRWWGGGYYDGFGSRGFGDFNNTVINNTNIVNNVNITNIYRNARVANGVTAVNAGQFGQNHRAFRQVSPADLRGANLVRGQVPVAPTRQSLHFANRQPNLANLPRTPANRQFSARQSPRQVARVPFEQQRQVMQQVARQTLSRPPVSAQAAGISANGTGRSQSAPSRQDRAVAGRGGSKGIAQLSPAPQASNPQAGNGWQRFGDRNRQQANPARMNSSRPDSERARTQPAAPPSSGGRASDNSGWQRFGQSGNRAARPDAATTRQNVNPSRPASQFGTAPNNSGGQTSSRFGSFGSQSRAPQASPPAVRERAERSYGGPSGSYGGSRAYDSRPTQTYRPSPPSGNSSSYSRPAQTYRPSPPSRNSGYSRPAQTYRPSPPSGNSGYSRPAQTYRPSPPSGSSSYSRPTQTYRPSPPSGSSSYSRPAQTYRPSPPSGSSGYSRPAQTYRPSPSPNGVGAYRPNPSPAGAGSYQRGGSSATSRRDSSPQPYVTRR
ncbi:MAG: FecR domain-containing protein [Candidatus Solibacter usitatus]|nr:FecR domain-containing protein [Candidatus Solibacter usitatus]